jgi:formylglycine-generating enzyme required for sulfatase activity
LWGEDWKEPEFEYPYDAADGREDLQAGDNVRRVVRGGSFYYYRTYARSTYRFNHSPRDTWRYTGFRVVASFE